MSVLVVKFCVNINDVLKLLKVYKKKYFIEMVYVFGNDKVKINV